MSHRVVVIGGGFGGLRTVQGLRGAGVETTLIAGRLTVEANLTLSGRPEILALGDMV